MEYLALTILIIVFLVLFVSYLCFCKAFRVSKNQKKIKEEYPLPPGRIYAPYRDMMIEWMNEVRAMPYEEFCISSFDGLRLYAKYYEYEKGAPMEIMFHGYRGNAERDLCGGVQRAFSLGRSVLIVDQRSAGKSDGKVITFGIKESRDCLSWVDFAIEHFGKDVRIILTGISMGASTVMIAAGESLPENVVGILADCGYSSPKEIIKKVICDMKLPPNLSYPFVKLGALLFGRVDIEKYSCEQALKNCKKPIIFFHGDDDRYVPCEMSVQNHAACVSPKKLVLMKGAGHGMCYLMYPEQYLSEVAQFFTQNGVYTEIKK